MLVRVHDTVATLVQSTDLEREWLRDYLSFDDEAKAFRKNYRTRRVERVQPPKVRLFDIESGNFPAGVLPLIARRLAEVGGQLDLIDARSAPVVIDSDADLAWLRPYQLAGVRAVIERERGIISAGTGSGKCLGIGTSVLHYDGKITAVEKVSSGDLLMGPDGRPRRVLSTTTGRGEMFRVVPVKGEPWTCNAPHVLTLVHTARGDIVDVPLARWLEWDKTAKHRYKLFQPEAVAFNGETAIANLPIDPYFVGLWFGDGRKDLTQGVQISKPDSEIEAACRDIAARWELEFRRDECKSCPTYRLVVPQGQRNPLLTALRATVGNGETIPTAYLTASLEARRELLAGLVDTDGYLANGYFEIAQKRAGVANGIEFLARSLGLRTTRREKYVDGVAYQRVNILGDISTIPTRIARKKAPHRRQIKNALRTGFKVEPIGRGDYAGFTLDGDGRFLLGDFTVTHNTEIAIGLTRAIPCPWTFIVHRAELMHQAAERYRLRFAESIGQGIEHPEVAKALESVVGRFGDGSTTIGSRLTVATFQTVKSKLETEEGYRLLRGTRGLIVDECHTLPSTSYFGVSLRFERARYRIGLSGTPLDRGDKRSILAVASLGPVIHKVASADLVELGVLARPEIRMVKVSQDIWKPTYQGLYGEAVVRSKLRNRTVVEIASRLAKRPAVVFFKELRHGQRLAELLEQRGLNVALVEGRTKVAGRQSIGQSLARGDLDVVVSSVVWQEGIDIPELESVIVAAGGKSIIAALQRAGRGMRANADKTTFQLWDVYDEGSEILERHSKARRKAYEREGFRVELVDLPRHP